MKRPTKLPAPNAIDRLVGVFSPRTRLERQLTRGTIEANGGGWHGGSRSRRSMQEWKPVVRDADGDTLPDLADLRVRSRDMARNTPIATGAIATVVTNVVGVGLRVRPQIDRAFLGLDNETADAWERQAERAFATWAESEECDLTRTQRFDALQGLVCRAALESGDLLAVLRHVERAGSPYRLKLQLIEADQIENPNRKRDGARLGDKADGNPVAGGVELDAASGAPVAYWIRSHHPGDRSGLARTQWKRLPAFGQKTGRRQVLHVHERARIGQTRGVPYLAPVVEMLKQLDRYSEAEIWAAVINSCFAVGVKTETGQGMDLPAGGTDGTGADQQEIVITKPGQIFDLAEGEEVNSFTPGRPNTAFDGFVTAVLRQIGVALELPFEVLIKHFQSSYSAARAAMLDAWRFFRRRRAWLATTFCQPVYEALLAEEIAAGRLDAPGFFDDAAVRHAYCGAVWIGPAQGQIDPLREAKADELYVDMDVKTLAEVTAERTGGDWERNAPQRARERQARRESGAEASARAPGEETDDQPDNAQEA